MAKVSLSEILRLSVSERLQLAQDIWDSIASDPEAVAMSNAQKEELDRRLAALEQDPQAGSSWAEVKQRLRTGS